ncbi:MAG: bifunctional diaminohydroxyphosphoribosylaminopyrimidine deaminase/5-amino-6-(5-phosphoribosylamino)uracil reductase RibD [Bacteroidetes bacterium]|nr:bifunctional diaminohydroxyphosphoribosylaminopyrimidine deaminase/5-amino-6-(5-phosphoribosylamino)uracil reductase RibD [Bacteroidota bacterium]
MQRALLLAQRGGGWVSPNPKVGAVLVHEGRIIGEGWHQAYGGVHAEVACLQNVLDADRPLIRESTLYVSLEPCAHQGKQPPCAHRIIEEGIPRVVLALEDPFPQVQGRGIALLQAAGVEVTTGVCHQEARWLCRNFLSAQEMQRPYIILKWAESQDGFIAPADGSRRQLSNHFSQTLVHRWRSEESAIMVGFRTALADNPRLNVRLWEGPQPLRIVLDKKLRIPKDFHLLNDEQPTWIVHEGRDYEAGNIRFLSLPFNGHLLPALLQKLLQAGKNSLLVEGGAALLKSFIAAGFWDEARVFQTKHVFGEGLQRPLLPESTCCMTTTIGNDCLRLFQPRQAFALFPDGAAL